MSGKRYAFVPMDVEEVGPQKVEKKKSSKQRHREDRDRHRDRDRDTSRRHKSRSRSPQEARSSKSKSFRTRGRDHGDADDPWGDEEPPSDDGAAGGEPEFQESASKRVKLSHEEREDDDAELSDTARDRKEAEAFAKRLKARDDGRTKKL
ncbi:hypothetical protein BJ170DRAFT_649525, partial [Xylariales sp. AK1849]